MMYVVTQDKKRLVPLTNEIYVHRAGYGNDNYEIRIFRSNLSQVLGTYKSEERAMEVLLDIASDIHSDKKLTCMPKE